jgi:catechol 1,2-dioxygenase
MEELKTVLFYLLSLGGLIIASMLFTGQVEVEINDLPTPPGVATPTAVAEVKCQLTPGYRVPGYLSDAVFTNTLAPAEWPGERLTISGTVYASDCQTPLPGAIIEIWQPDAEGNYANTHSPILRGRLRTDSQGQYQFTTIKPGHPPVGRFGLLPARIHYWVRYQDENPLVTRFFFADDPYLEKVEELTSTLITHLEEQPGPEGPFLHGQLDIVLPVEPPLNPADCLHPVRNVSGNSYLPDAPSTTQLAPPDASGEPLRVSGTIYQADWVTPAANTRLEIWQTDAKGHYSRADTYAFRAQLKTDETGRYQFTTTKPGHFQVDCEFLPAHIHYKVTYGNWRPLLASLYFEGDPYLTGALLVTPRLIKPLEQRMGPEGPVLETTFDIILPGPLSGER